MKYSFSSTGCWLLCAILMASTTAFMAPKLCGSGASRHYSIQNEPQHHASFVLMAKISRERRDQLGIGDGEDEYDLDMALDQNTDPLITKLIAGSLIVAILAGLVVGVVIPATTDYGDLCNPLLSGGRC